MKLSKAAVIGAIFSILMALPLQGAFAQSDKAFIEYRQKVMKSIGANMGSIAAILKAKLPFKENIAGHARNIHVGSSMILSAFDKRISEGATDAKSKIWRDRAGFKEKIEALKTESSRLASMADSASMQDLVAQVKKVGKACGGCHKNYRKPKKESYKRK